MTTLAYCKNVLAADRRVSHDSEHFATTTKIFEITPDLYIALCGNLVSFVQAVAWAKKNHRHLFDPLFPRQFDFESLGGIAVRRVGNTIETYIIFSGLILLKNEDEYLVNGSGSFVALAALKAGASAQEAIRIASTIDSSTGDGIDVKDFSEWLTTTKVKTGVTTKPKKKGLVKFGQ